MIGPFLSTLSIALQTSTSPAGGIAFLALTVRTADLLSLFLFSLSGRGPVMLLQAYLRFWSLLANHNLSAEEVSPCDPDGFLEQSEGIDLEVRMFKIKNILHSGFELQYNGWILLRTLLLHLISQLNLKAVCTVIKTILSASDYGAWWTCSTNECDGGWR